MHGITKYAEAENLNLIEMKNETKIQTVTKKK
jgi:hypothetical protein